MSTMTDPRRKGRAHVQRFRTFEEAREALYQEGYERGFDVESVRKFLDMVHHLRPLKYKPGLRRFRSFREAQKSIITELVEASRG